LKEELRKLDLSYTDCKNELVMHLNESTISDVWIDQEPEVQTIEDTERVADKGSIHGTEIQSKSQPQDVYGIEMEL